MRGTIGTIIVFLVCLVVIVLYMFLGKGQINQAAVSIEGQIEEQDVKFEHLRKIRAEIPVLKASLPLWREQLEIFNTAIPQSMDDHVFFSNLVSELGLHPDVSLLSFNSVMGGPWLGNIEEKMENKLIEYEIDVESAKSIRVSFITMELLGEFDEVLTVVENLKKYRRLYTIDMVAGPGGRGSGTITSNNEPEITPLQFTGRLYFNLPEPKVDVNELTRMYLDVFAGMLQNDMVAAGQTVANRSGSNTQTQPSIPQTEDQTETSGDVSAEPTENSDGEAGQEVPVSEDPANPAGDIALVNDGISSTLTGLKDRVL